MKKLLFGLIATALLSNLSFCQNLIKPIDYGFYHNEAVKLYNEKYLGGDIQKVGETNIQKMNADMLVLLKEKYPNEFENVNLKQLDSFYSSSTTIANYDFANNWKKNKESYIENGYVSAKVSILIDDILSNGKDYNDIITRINSFKKKHILTDTEVNEITVFESVLTSSNELWTKSNPIKNKKNPCTPRTIVSDAGASLITFYFGPLSLVAGAVSSLITYYSDPNC